VLSVNDGNKIVWISIKCKYYAEYFYKTNILQSPSSGHTSSWWTVPESITPKFKQDIISMSRIIQNSSTNVISTCYTEAKLIL
jgi:hypothetical protein